MLRTLTLISVFCLPTILKSQPIVIDFEGLQMTPIAVLDQFSQQGVTFNGPSGRDYTLTPGLTHSGTKAIEVCFAMEVCTAPLVIDFTTGQNHTKLWVGYSSQLPGARNVILQAFDANSIIVGTASVTFVPSNGPIPAQQSLEINSSTLNIRKLVLKFEDIQGTTAYNNGLVIDDVEFSTAGALPDCSSFVGPTITLSQPLHYGPPRFYTPIAQINQFTLQGNIATEAPLVQATLTVVGTTGTKQFDLLNGIITPTSNSFGPTKISGALFPGLNKIYVYIRHCGWDRTDSARIIFEPIAPGTGFKFLWMEITQATQDRSNSVPLVANKPTMIRLYISTTGPTQIINGVSAAITATKPGGITLAPLLRSTNTITVNSLTDINDKRGNLTETLNFLLPSDWTSPSTLHFEVSKLYIQGTESNISCEGCGNLDEINAPRYAQFQPTKPLNLVLVPYEYPRSEDGSITPDILLTPMGTLKWVNTVFPLSGSFPYDASGINIVRYLPIRTTNRVIRSEDEKNDFLDDLEDLRCYLQEQNENTWPSDFRLFAMVPTGSGGIASFSKKAAFGDTWALEKGPVSFSQFKIYGRIWAHELGHTFGRKHAGFSHGEKNPDPNFPYPHGSLGDYGLAISVDNSNGLPFLIRPGTGSQNNPHAHDFMAYGPLDVNNTYDWVSPYTYKALFNSFRISTQSSSMSNPITMQKLVLKGRIDKNKKISVRPIYQVNTQLTTNSGVNGKYSIELIGENNKVLSSYRFDPQPDDYTESYGFNEYVPWKNGTKLIMIKHRKLTIYKQEVSLHKPWIRITSPAKDEVWNNKSTITWEAGDNDKDSLTFTVFYNTGYDSIWLPLATGIKTFSTTVNTQLLPGSRMARIKVRVTDGVNTSEAVMNTTFIVSDKPPLVAILSHTNGQVIPLGTMPQFTGVAFDPEDGMLSNANLTWVSNRDGMIESKNCKSDQPLSQGRHQIILTATDSKGHSASTTIYIIIGKEELHSD